MKRGIAAAALLLAFGASAADPFAEFEAIKARAPADVASYMDRRAGCNHWSGEEPYDAERRAEINAAMLRLRCDTIDADGAALRAKYANAADSLRAIDYADKLY